MNIGDRIKKLRKECGKSQEEFGKAIGIGKTSVSKLETGENKPSDQTIILICREFDVLEDWLRYGKEPMRDDNIEFGEICREIRVKDKKAKQAILDYWELSPEDKELFWKFVEKFMK